ncbi:Gfo/Idh/MocA family oxidoreductase [Erythrobacter litoralis]|nr:Gfo/Idh/MocA family oxidoreductase [Erythrobacter litoralis]
MSITHLKRRNFLKSSAIGLSAGLAAPALAQSSSSLSSSGIADPGTGPQAAKSIPNAAVGRPQPELTYENPLPKSQQLGWAVAGVGHYAQNRALPAIARARRAKLTALVSGNPEKAGRVGAGYGVDGSSIYDYGDMASLAQDDAVDVVYVITPNSIHEPIVTRAFEAGKHVMCEKPFATSSAACQRMIDAGKAAGRKLMVAYRAHFEPHNVMAKKLIDEGVLGDVWFGTSDHHRVLDPKAERDQWRMVKEIAGGGSLPDIGIYAFNGLIWLLGEEPVRVRGVLTSPPGEARFNEVEAFSRVDFEFASGKVAQISSGYTGNKKRIDIIGTEATITMDPATAYEGNQLSLITNSEKTMIVPDKLTRFQFDDEIDHFCRAIQEGTEIATPGEMGLRDLKIIEAIQRSGETNDWVDLNL